MSCRFLIITRHHALSYTFQTQLQKTTPLWALLRLQQLIRVEPKAESAIITHHKLHFLGIRLQIPYIEPAIFWAPILLHNTHLFRIFHEHSKPFINTRHKYFLSQTFILDMQSWMNIWFGMRRSYLLKFIFIHFLQGTLSVLIETFSLLRPLPISNCSWELQLGGDYGLNILQRNNSPKSTFYYYYYSWATLSLLSLLSGNEC